MKLFVWYNPIDVTYGGSVLFVMARTEEAARRKAAHCSVSAFGIASRGRLGTARAERLGAPDAVLDHQDGDGLVYTWEE